MMKDLTRRDLIRSTATAGLALASTTFTSTKVARADSRPNILVIMADDLGKEGLSVYGNPIHDTPNLDRLAAQGRVFTRCFSSPACSPSRAQFMTGLYPHRTGIDNVIKEDEVNVCLDPRKPNLFRTMAGAGYRVYVAGKWHVCHLHEHPKHPAEMGVHEYLLSSHRGQNKDRMARYVNPEVVENGIIRKAEGAFGPDLYTDWLIDRIKNSQTPYFAVFPSKLVHTPMIDPITRTRGSRHQFTAMVSYLDSIVGRLIEVTSENTIVFFTSDNGSPKNVGGGKGTFKDLGCNVPLIVKGPSVAKGRSDALVDLSDFHSTIAQLGGTEAHRAIDGRSFLGLIQGSPAIEREWVFLYCACDGFHSEGVPWAIRSKNHKLLANGDFYDFSIEAQERRPVPKKLMNDDLHEIRNWLESAATALL